MRTLSTKAFEVALLHADDTAHLVRGELAFVDEAVQRAHRHAEALTALLRAQPNDRIASRPVIDHAGRVEGERAVADEAALLARDVSASPGRGCVT